jgi:hypothetical protein
MKKENKTTNCPTETIMAKKIHLQNHSASISADNPSGVCDEEQETRRTASRFRSFMKMLMDHFTNGKMTAYTFYY